MPFVNQEFITTLHSQCFIHTVWFWFGYSYICSHLYFILRGKAVDNCFSFPLSSHVYKVKIKSSHQINNFPAVSVYIFIQTKIYVCFCAYINIHRMQIFLDFFNGVSKQNFILLQWPWKNKEVYFKVACLNFKITTRWFRLWWIIAKTELEKIKIVSARYEHRKFISIILF